MNLYFPINFPVDEQKTVEVTSKTDVVDAAVKPADVANLEPKLAEAAIKTDELKALNNASNDVAINKTTTTVTVNVTQTKVTTVDDAKKSQELGEVVSTVSSIADAAVSAIEKVESKSQRDTSEIEALDDIEMVEADADCEMKDVSQKIEETAQVVTTTSTVTTSTVVEQSSEPAKTVEADSAVISTTAATESAVASSNEADQKIDDVEKNISNLFNGDDNVVSTNDKSKAEASIVSSQNEINSLKNGLAAGANSETQSNDAIKDNNDLVSILAGNDKPDENISSSSISAAEAQQKPTTNSNESKSIDEASSSTKDASEAAAAKPSSNSIENKLLKGVTSTPSNITTTNVYNSTPIQKQFEISSENVSTISEPANEADHGLGSKATARKEIISSHSSTANDKSLDLSTTVTGLYCKCDYHKNSFVIKSIFFSFNK